MSSPSSDSRVVISIQMPDGTRESVFFLVEFLRYRLCTFVGNVYYLFFRQANTLNVLLFVRSIACSLNDEELIAGLQDRSTSMWGKYLLDSDVTVRVSHRTRQNPRLGGGNFSVAAEELLDAFFQEVLLPNSGAILSDRRTVEEFMIPLLYDLMKRIQLSGLTSIEILSESGLQLSEHFVPLGSNGYASRYLTLSSVGVEELTSIIIRDTTYNKGWEDCIGSFLTSVLGHIRDAGLAFADRVRNQDGILVGGEALDYYLVSIMHYLNVMMGLNYESELRLYSMLSQFNALQAL